MIMLSVEHLQIVVRLALWFCVFGIFVELGFGLVFVIVSALVALFLSTSTGQRARDRLSPYSVFNPNFEEITGTYNADTVAQSLNLGKRK